MEQLVILRKSIKSYARQIPQRQIAYLQQGVLLAYTAPAGASSVTYQVQCLSSSASVCNPQATGTGALQPSPGQSSLSGILITGLTNDVSYQCFSVASYTLNSATYYACSGPATATPFGEPQVNTVTSASQKLTVTPSSYTAPSGGSNVKYQVQCLSQSATICDLSATGTGALLPSPSQSSTAAIEVTGLTDNTIYQCFSVVTYDLNGNAVYML